MRRADGRAALPKVAAAAFLVAALAVLGVALVACEPAGEGQLDLAVYGLESCSEAGGVGAPVAARVVVRGPEPCENDPEQLCVQELANESEKWGGTVEVGGIPEGNDREVTILAYADGDASGQILGFARATGVRIQKGESTGVTAILSRFGGVSCPSKPAEFTHRTFASATSVGDDRVVLAGGFTGVQGDTLGAPDNGVYLYESKTGALTRVAQLSKARGAHAAAYIPGKDWVVFFGGASSLKLGAAGSFPLVFDVPASGDAIKSYEVLDLNAGPDKKPAMLDIEQACARCEQCCSADGTDLPGRPEQCTASGVSCAAECRCTCSQLTRTMERGRVLAQPAVMSDGFVIVTGGGDFPNHETSDYRLAEVFDPAGNCGTGGFQDPMTAPRMESIRAGHTLTFIEATDAGRYRFLLWGGTKDTEGGGGTFPIGESYTESSQQFKGISGVFRQVGLSDASLAPNLYFHSMTPLSGRRFLLAGGVRRVGDNAFEAPRADDLYLLSLSGEDTYSVDIQRVSDGLTTGRFLHSGTTNDARHVFLFGGYSGFDGATLSEPRAFDLFAGAFVSLSGTPPLPRAGHRAVVLTDDTVLLVGGMQTSGDLDGGAGLVEVYTPSFLNPLVQ